MIYVRDAMHLDKKWFVTVCEGQKVYILLVKENVPTPKLNHRSWVPKIMFLVMVGRPHQSTYRTCFDGLIR